MAGDKGSRGIFRCEGGIIFDLVFTVQLKAFLLASQGDPVDDVEALFEGLDLPGPSLLHGEVSES